MPCRTITNQQYDVVSILLAEFSQKYRHTVRITIGHNKKKRITCDWFNRPIGVAILPNVVAWYTRADPFFAPAVFRLVYTAETGFILKHQPNCGVSVDIF